MTNITAKILQAGLTSIQIYVIFGDMIASDNLQPTCFNQIEFTTGETIEIDTLTNDLNIYNPQTDTFTSYYFDSELTSYFRK